MTPQAKRCSGYRPESARDGHGNAVDLTVHNGDVLFVADNRCSHLRRSAKAGAYPLQRDLTVRQAIAIGGGLTVRGRSAGCA